MSQLIKYVHKDNWLHWTFKIARLSDIACNCKSESIDHADQYLDSMCKKISQKLNIYHWKALRLFCNIFYKTKIEI